MGELIALAISASLVLAVLFGNVLATVLVARCQLYTRRQKVIQTVLLWIVPMFCVAVILVRRRLGRLERTGAADEEFTSAPNPSAYSDADLYAAYSYFQGDWHRK